MKRIVIIGAGIAGLSTAYYLSKSTQQGGQQLEIALLEKGGRLGGSILTEQADGFLMEGGPDCFISEKPWALKLCEELGLAQEVIGTNQQVRRTFILRGRRLHEIPEGFMLLAPTSLWPFVKSSLFSLPGKARMGLDLILPRKKSDVEESLGAFVRRRLGREALERIAEPLVAGIHAGDPETMSLQSTFPRFIDLEQGHRSLIWGMYQRKKQFAHLRPRYTMFITLRHGMEGLVTALKKTLSPGIISLEQGVVGMEKITGKPSQGPRYRLRLRGTKKAMEADAVVLATPSFATADLLQGIAGEIARQLTTIPYCSTATINLAYERSQIGHPLDGYGFVVPRLEKRSIMAATFSSVKFTGRAPQGKVLLRCFVGGAKNEELVSWGDDELLAAVRGDIEEILEIKDEPLLQRIYRWHKAMPQYTLGHDERLSRIEQGLAKHPGLFLTGSAYRGIGISDCVHEAELTVQKILQFISK
ncbi:MAG: protoporphyrinogen oxidase [Deltaproteobacteria bacterium RBG_16_54_11]|nr:MAG: protoporphyrinogen oxidase [Deltaproteobacteria bacterium RBG_16_54_11]